MKKKGENIGKLINPILASIVFMFIFIAFVSADISITNPLSNQNFTTIEFNVTFENSSVDILSPVDVNTTIFSNASGSFVAVATADTLICDVLSGTNVSCYISATASELTDGLGASFYIQLGNLTDFKNSTTATDPVDLGIYTSNPSCAFDVNLDSLEVNDAIGTDTIDSSTGDALFDLTYSWSLYDPGNTVQTTSSSQNVTFDLEDFDELGDFTLALILSDSGNNPESACTNKTLFVSSGSDRGNILGGVSKDSEGVNNAVWFVLGLTLVVIIIGVLAFLAVSMSKKKR